MKIEEAMNTMINLKVDKLHVEITKTDVEEHLSEVCETVHAGCNNECPVYKKCVEDDEFSSKTSNKCPYFRDGQAMFERLKRGRIEGGSVKKVYGTGDEE